MKSKLSELDLKNNTKSQENTIAAQRMAETAKRLLKKVTDSMSKKNANK